MRIAAGVILIIAAILNLVAGGLYLLGGALASGASDLGTAMVEAAEEEAAAQAAEAGGEVADMAEARQDLKKAKLTGGALKGWGAFMILSCAILITGSVFLFMGKNAGFIAAACIIAIIIEGVGIYLTKFGVMNLFGLVGGVLGLLAMKGLSAKGQGPAEAQAA